MLRCMSLEMALVGPRAFPCLQGICLETGRRLGSSTSSGPIVKRKPFLGMTSPENACCALNNLRAWEYQAANLSLAIREPAHKVLFEFGHAT